ncbi:MAG: hypothetical protein Q4G34_11655 [Micrococcus sp.]|nr:hypothetical protein [Micrococcus sp.]
MRAAGRSLFTLLAGGVLTMGVLGGCGAVSGPTPEEPTPTEAPTAIGGDTEDSAAPTASDAVPEMYLVTGVDEFDDTSEAASMDEAALATLVSERVGDGGAKVQTVVCDDGLDSELGASTLCTVSLVDAAQSDQLWNVYSTNTSDGSRGVLILRGEPLSEDFARYLSTPGTVVMTEARDASFGTEPLDPAQVESEAQQILADLGLQTEVGTCDTQLTFAEFTPSVCEVSGDVVRVVVLPAQLIGNGPGVLVIAELV